MPALGALSGSFSGGSDGVASPAERRGKSSDFATKGHVVTGLGLSSVAGVVDWLRKNFRVAAAEDLEVAYQIDLAGPAGGSLWVRIGEGRMRVGEGRDSQPDVILRLAAVDFFAVLAGTANPDLLFMDDRIEIEGDLSLALKLRSLFSREA